jgi:hypothetical protein
MASTSLPRVQERTSPLKIGRRKALNEWEGGTVGHDRMKVCRSVRCGPQNVVFAASYAESAARVFFVVSRLAKAIGRRIGLFFY